MISGDLRHARCLGISTSQRGTSLVQSLQQAISRGTYAEEFGAAHPQRSLRHADLRTKRGHVWFLVNAFSERFFETNHDSGMVVPGFGNVDRLVGGQAIDDCVKQLLLERPCHLGPLDQFVPRGLRKAAGLRKKTSESR